MIEVIWNKATAAGRNYEDLPTGTLMVMRCIDDYSWWAVSRKILSEPWNANFEEIARFASKEDALKWAHEKAQEVPAENRLI